MTGLKILCLASMAVVLCASAQAQPFEIPDTPIPHGHAHNDYEHEHPLWDALRNGFTSVEIDIHLADGALLVGHDPEDLKPERTLQSLYLNPLDSLIASRGGWVYRDSTRLQLLIDIKTEALSTYQVLDSALARYAGIITSYPTDAMAPLTVVISGNRPRAFMEAQPLRYASYDGRLNDLEQNAPDDLIHLLSDNWYRQFEWRGEGPLPAGDVEKLRRVLDQAHERGWKVRFWQLPTRLDREPETVWQELLEAGVDWINVDSLGTYRGFVSER